MKTSMDRPGARPRGQVTMKDVATRAGVALGTVSRVVNEYPDVDPRLRERVEKAIRELNYRPDARAQSFNRAASPLIGYILGNRPLLNQFHSRILQGVEEYCDEAGYLVIYSKFNYRPETKASELLLPRLLQSHGLTDCLILAGTTYENFVEALEEMGISYVLLGNNFVGSKELPPVDQVRFDDAAGAHAATRYLIELGHRHIWYIGDIALPWSRVKYDSYQRAMADNGLPPRAQTLGLADDYYANGYRSVKLILEKKLPITAILTNDDGALGAWDALTEAGLHVPQDVSLVGFGDNESVQVTVPPMSSVRIDRIEVGRQLAKMAIAKIKSPGRRLPEVALPTTLIRRGTTRPLLEASREQISASVAQPVG